MLIEQAAALEEAQHAASEEGLESAGVVGVEVGRLVEADLAVGLGEDAVEDDEVEVKWEFREDPKRWRKDTAPSCAQRVSRHNIQEVCPWNSLKFVHE